jgi:hypothetical protein
MHNRGMSLAEPVDLADPAHRLAALAGGCTAEEALGLFDELPAVEVDAVLGPWRGSEVPTGHRLDGMLVTAGWHGKRFESAESVHPLVFAAPGGGRVSVNPALVPMQLVHRLGPRVQHPLAARAFRAALPLLATRRPAARLRMVRHRGVVTAGMVYDALPIIDVFRRVDDDTLLGVMDLRGADPYVFALHRE